MTTETHDIHMSRAIKLAKKGHGRVSPNPLVGAVIVKDSNVIGEGYHEQFGQAHAETNAIDNCSESCQGADLYINLEPCFHTGKTPPCVDAIISAQFARVIISCVDPNPETAGQSIDKLRGAGIEVVVDVLQEQAEELNQHFFKLIKTGKPYILAKWAMTLDGKIATKTGDSKWISSEDSLDYAHQLRNSVDAIMIGLGTVLKDDPMLTCRRVKDGRNPTRILLDSRAKLPNGYQLFKTAKEIKTIVMATEEALPYDIERLESAGCEVVISPSRFGSVNIDAALQLLAQRGIGIVMLEGGSKILGSTFDAMEVDEVCIFIAPKLIGGKGGISPIGGSGRRRIGDAILLHPTYTLKLGTDIVIRGKVIYK